MSEIENQVTVIGSRDIATAESMKQHVQRIQEVMRAVMKPDVHYGKIPGTDKPTLYKPGAEVLGVTFHIASSYHVLDISVLDKNGEMLVARYRVKCVGTHQGSNTNLGEGVGECSSSEEKYKWRRATGRKEFDSRDESQRRVKYGRDYETQQVRTEPADIANTILKMSCKRAQTAMMLNVLAASDIFAQDLEDMPEGFTADEGEESQQRETKQRAADPKSRPNPTGKASEKQVGMLAIKIGQKDGLEESEFLAAFEIGAIADITFDKVNDALAWIKEWTPADASA